MNGSIYSKMCDVARNDLSQYSVLPCHFDILNFPLEISMEYPTEIFLKDTFEKYKELQKLYVSDKERLDTTENLCNMLIETIKAYKTGDVYKSYKTFEKGLMSIPKDYFIISAITPEDKFYRMRSDLNLTDEKEFYCLNSKLRYLCKAERYSIAGYPCFYVGYSRNDCKVEISEHGSIINLNLEKDDLYVFDITFNDQKPEDEMKFITIWPLIAACNMNYNYYDEKKATFKEEYLIPQFLTMFVQKNREKLREDKQEVYGIRYFSTRNRNLDVQQKGTPNDYRNVVFFPLGEGDDGINKLMDRFHFGHAENI